MAPPLVPALVAGLAAGLSAGGFLGFTGLAAGLLAGATSLVMSGLSKALAPKASTSNTNTGAKGGGVTRQVRQALTPRRLVMGEVRASGPYAFIGSTSENQFLHMIIILASHEVDEIGEIWVNEDSIPIDNLETNGNVKSGKYFKDGQSYLRIKKFTGAAGQPACPDMIAAFPEWTANHKLSGMAYIYVRMFYNADVYASGIPNISAWIRGYKVKDTRTGVSAWHHNAMLINRAYLTDTIIGRAIPESRFNDDYTDSGANVCEEFVTTTNLPHTVTAVDDTTDIIKVDGTTLKFQTGDRVTISTTGTLPAGLSAATDYFVIVYQRKDVCRIKLASSYANAITQTGIDITDEGIGTHTITKNAEPRYTCGGTIDSDVEGQAIIVDLLASMAGKCIYSGGRWTLKVGAYETPTLSFDENDLCSGYTVSTKASRRDRFNRVIGTYISPLNNAQPADYPEVKNATYRAQDNDELLSRPFDLLFTQRPHTAQRLAKITLETYRQEQSFMARFKLSAFKTQVGDNVFLSIARMGWVNKIFEVVEWSLCEEEKDGAMTPYIQMTLKETASTVFDWNNGEETVTDPAPNSELPNAFNVAGVTGLRFDSFPVTTLNGDTLFRIVLGWDAHPDYFVLEGGQFEVQYKQDSEVDFKPSFFLAGNIMETELVQGSINVEYDLRIRAVNNIGVRSAWNNLTGVIAGSSGGVTASRDYGAFVADAVGSSQDYGAFVADPVGTSEDWEYFI